MIGDASTAMPALAPQERRKPIEWTSVLNDRAYLDVIVGEWLNFFPLRPMAEVGTIDKFTTPARIFL